MKGVLAGLNSRFMFAIKLSKVNTEMGNWRYIEIVDNVSELGQCPFRRFGESKAISSNNRTKLHVHPNDDLS